MTVPGRPSGTARLLILVAALVVALEAVAALAIAVLSVLDLSSDTVGIGVGAGLFFGAYGLGQLFAAGALMRGVSWARSPLVVTQLIQLLLAWQLGDSTSTVIVVALAVSGIVVLACLLSPPVTRALRVDDPV